MTRRTLLLAMMVTVALMVAIALLDGGGAWLLRAPPASANGPVQVLWATHTTARFEPCGCSAGMNGGLLRRAALLAKENQATALSIEGGGWSAGSADHLQLRTAAYLAGLVAARVAVAGLGRDEVALGSDLLAKHLTTAAAVGLPVVCANLVDTSGTPVGLPLVRVQAGGRTFVVTSVVPSDAYGAGLRVNDPAESVARIAATAGTDPLIVIADLDEGALSELARAAPSIALVVGGDVAAPSQEPLAVGRTRIIAQANHGKSLGAWTWDEPRCRFTLLADTLPEDAAQRERVIRLQQQIAAATLAADQHLPLAPGQVAFSGPAACTACHASAAAVWQTTRHAHAREALTPRGYRADPDCLRCHVTGLGRPDGWFRTDPRTELAAVSCESCHGPGSEHVASAGKTPLPPAGPATCVSCHDADNSPHFDYATYWGKIAHGK